MANTNDPGEAAVPAGYMLGEGWEVSRYSGRTECDKMGCGVRASVFLVQPPSASIHARCPAHAVEMGALVPIEPPVAEPGARCRVCGYYETSLARATERYAHCPACGRAPHWIPVGDDDVRESVAPVAEPAQPVCKYCVWWKESARGKLCVKCGKVYGGRVGTRSDDPPPVPPGPVPVETEGYEDSQGRWVIRKPATAAAPAKAPPEGEPVGTPPPCHERCGEVFLRGTATYCADVLGRKPTDPCHCHLTEYTVTVYCTAACKAAMRPVNPVHRRTAGGPAVTSDTTSPAAAPANASPRAAEGHFACVGCGLRRNFEAGVTCDECNASGRAWANVPLSPEQLDASVAWSRQWLSTAGLSPSEYRRHYATVQLADQLATAIRERDEQRGRAERAEAEATEWQRSHDAKAAEVEQLRAKLVEAQRRANANGDLAMANLREADARIYRTGWADGAKATREATAKVALGQAAYLRSIDRTKYGDGALAEAEAIANRIEVLPLPVCPEGPPEGTGEAVRVFAAENARVQEAAAKGGLRAAGTGAVTSGEATPPISAIERAHQRVPLWDAINRVVAASGGNAGNTSVARQKAVVEVERAVDALQADAIKAAVASERERCLAWVELKHRYWESVECDVLDPIRDGIRSGADAPGAGKP